MPSHTVFRSVFHRTWFLCAFSLCRVISAFFSLRPFVLRLILLISIENISYSVRIVNVSACIKFSKQRVLSSCSTIERTPSSFVALGGWYSCRAYGQCRPHLPLTAPSAVPAALYFDRWWICGCNRFSSTILPSLVNSYLFCYTIRTN